MCPWRHFQNVLCEPCYSGHGALAEDSSKCIYIEIKKFFVLILISLKTWNSTGK